MFEEPLEIVCTEEDCLEACRGTERYCVVSTAIGRLIPEATHIKTNVDTIRFSIVEDGKRYRVVYRTPEPVRDYVVAFDGGKEPEPMTFMIESPQVTEKVPPPPGRARTPSFKAQGAPKRREIRVFGEKSFGERLVDGGDK